MRVKCSYHWDTTAPWHTHQCSGYLAYPESDNDLHLLGVPNHLLGKGLGGHLRFVLGRFVAASEVEVAAGIGGPAPLIAVILGLLSVREIEHLSDVLNSDLLVCALQALCDVL